MLFIANTKTNLRGIGRGVYPLPPAPPCIRVRTGWLPRVPNRSRANEY